VRDDVRMEARDSGGLISEGLCLTFFWSCVASLWSGDQHGGLTARYQWLGRGLKSPSLWNSLVGICERYI